MSGGVLIAVTHLLGAGHLTRAAALARAFAEAGHETTLVSGGRPSPLLRLGPARLVQLPPVRGAVGDLRTLRDEFGTPATPGLLAERRRLLLETLREVSPAAMVTELYPFGRRSLSGEFDALVEAAAALPVRPLVACSIRDVLATPDRPEKRDAASHRIARFYDLVLVHGDPDFLPLGRSWPVDAALAGQLRYTGYVDDGEAPAPSGEDAAGTILVSGGSSAAALPLYRAALDAARRLPDRGWTLLVGHAVPEREWQALAAAVPGNVALERARPDFRRLLRGCALFVGQAGYNTVVDLIVTGVRAVLVPFEEGGETEQRLRAEVLAERGLGRLLPEAELDGARLSTEVATSLGSASPPALAIRQDGARETVRLVEAALSLRDAGRTRSA